MARTIKDTDYLAVSARIRAMETTLLSPERMEQILSAQTDEDVEKVLRDCGYPELDFRHPESMDEALAADREALMSDLAGSVPDSAYVTIFRLKYDYHNVKSILKARAMGTDPRRMLIDAGTVPAEELLAAVSGGDQNDLPEALAAAIAEAKEVLDTTRDPQLSDIVLDRCYYQNMLQQAEATGSAFLTGYVQTQIDAVNLKSLVRTLRMGKSAEFLKGALLEGGSLEAEEILRVAAADGSGLTELYDPTVFRVAAEAGAEAVGGGALTAFEKLCDDAVSTYLDGAQMIPFGEAPVLRYLAAKETEYTNLRILLLGYAAGIAPDVIRSRLRASSV